VDGGTTFYGANGLPNDPGFFPLAVWFESVTGSSDTAKDKAAGLNTYMLLTQNSSASLVRSAGMYTIPAVYDRYADEGSEVKGWFLADEQDMLEGPGSAPCGQNQSGYTCMTNRNSQRPTDGRKSFANYGKGVAFWESDAEARTFVNTFQNVVSADTYWFSDQNICSQWEGGKIFGNTHTLTPDECIRASNYGWTIDRLRGLEPGALDTSKPIPVWGFVEVAPQSGRHTPTGAEIQAATWSSIIHGARGIVYFNHAFAGPCNGSQHFLRDCDPSIRAAVTDLNAQITALAPVINSPFVDGDATSPGADNMVKWSGGHYYVFAGNHDNASKTVPFSLTCTGDATATVVDEHRTIPVTNGKFSDGFSANTTHIYRIDGGTTCTP
jgi:hypothetical protein